MDRPNLTVLTGALVTRVTFEGNRADGVEFSHNSQIHRVSAGSEVVLSLGAMRCNSACPPIPDCINTFGVNRRIAAGR